MVIRHMCGLNVKDRLQMSWRQLTQPPKLDWFIATCCLYLFYDRKDLRVAFCLFSLGTRCPSNAFCLIWPIIDLLSSSHLEITVSIKILRRNKKCVDLKTSYRTYLNSLSLIIANLSPISYVIIFINIVLNDFNLQLRLTNLM